jgi:uncharacterized protein (TIGR02599 family)
MGTNSPPTAKAAPPSLQSLSGPRRRAFTIIEILVASAVFMLLVVVLLSVLSQASTVTQRATAKISSFQGARTAFEAITRNLSQATLNSYWDYYPNATNPTDYIRKSELHFLIEPDGMGLGQSGTGQCIYFQAPIGSSASFSLSSLQNLLNAVGYFITYEQAEALPAPFTATSNEYRYFLMQAVEDTTNLAVYNSDTSSEWVNNIVDYAHPIAENIIFLGLWPRISPVDDPDGTALGRNYTYDSRAGASAANQPRTAHQLPPVVQVTMVALDEPSAKRLCTSSTPPFDFSDLFTDVGEYQDDIDEIEKRLTKEHANFRIFTAMIPLRESRME